MTFVVDPHDWEVVAEMMVDTENSATEFSVPICALCGCPQGAEMSRKVDMIQFKEVLKRKFMECPGSNPSAWEAGVRS